MPISDRRLSEPLPWFFSTGFRFRLASSRRNLVILEPYDLGDSIPDPGGTGYRQSFNLCVGETLTVIPDTEAAQHVGQNITVESVVVKVFMSKNGNTFLNFGALVANGREIIHTLPESDPLALC